MGKFHTPCGGPRSFAAVEARKFSFRFRSRIQRIAVCHTRRAGQRRARMYGLRSRARTPRRRLGACVVAMRVRHGRVIDHPLGAPSPRELRGTPFEVQRRRRSSPTRRWRRISAVQSFYLRRCHILEKSDLLEDARNAQAPSGAAYAVFSDHMLEPSAGSCDRRSHSRASRQTPHARKRARGVASRQDGRETPRLRSDSQASCG